MLANARFLGLPYIPVSPKRHDLREWGYVSMTVPPEAAAAALTDMLAASRDP